MLRIFRPSVVSRRWESTGDRARARGARSRGVILSFALLSACGADPQGPVAPALPFGGASSASGVMGSSQSSGGAGAAAMPQQAGRGGVGGQPPQAGGGGMAGVPPLQQAGMGGAGVGAAGGSGGAAGATAGGAVTFTRIYDTFFMTCRSEVCHGGMLDIPGVGLDMQTKESAYASLVGRMAAATGACASSGLMRVVPSDPAKSLVFLKVSGTQPCGDEMPPAAMNTKENIELLRAWIAGGALNN